MELKAVPKEELTEVVASLWSYYGRSPKSE